MSFRFRFRLTYVYIYTGGFTVSSEISKEFLYQVELNRDRYIAERRIDDINRQLVILYRVLKTIGEANYEYFKE